MFRVLVLVLFVHPLLSYSQVGSGVVRGRIFLQAGYETRGSVLVQLRAGEQMLRETETDSFGNFEFTDVAPGSYVVRASAPGFREVEHSVDYSSSTVVLHLLRDSATPRAAGSMAAGSQVVDFRQLAVPQKARDEYAKALRDLKDGRTQRGVDRLLKVLQLAPFYYDAHWQLGLEFLKSNQLAEAEREFQSAAALNPKAAEPLMVLGILYSRSSRLENAVTVLERAVELNPKSARAFLYLGSSLYDLNQLSRAQTALKRAREIDAGLHDATFLLANVYVREGRMGEAYREIETYIHDDPEGLQKVAAVRLRDALQHRFAPGP